MDKPTLYGARGLRCYEKCGFRREGVLRESARIDGAWHADIIMSILENEWRETNDKDI
ncbi:MAG: GNAT family N-acetyltransferase [Oscillospiraceae bacterium]|nr:GNAT family N-acetyltransferase [Oscillospiraceae bacterium]